MVKLNLEKIQLCFQYLLLKGEVTTSDSYFQQENDTLDFLEHIKGYSTLDKLNRINIYSQGYYQRLLACLKVDYPSLVTFLGDELFYHFTRMYIKEYPSKSYTLYELGDMFYMFLQNTQLALENSSDEEEALYQFPLTLISIEQVRKRLLTSKGIESLQLIDLKPTDLLRVNPSVEILPLKLPILRQYYQLINRQDIEEIPNLNSCVILGFRVNYKSQFMYITEQEAVWLEEVRSTEIFNNTLDRQKEEWSTKFKKLQILY